MDKRYKQFRRDVVGILLRAIAGSYRSDQADKLTDYLEFRTYFKANQRENWYAAINELNSNDNEYLKELIVEIELLSYDIGYVLNNVSIDDDEVFAFFKRLLNNVYQLINSPLYTVDPGKYLGDFVWDIMAQDSNAGYLKDDIIQRMISQI